MAVWQDLYQKTKLDRFEIFALEQELVMKGVKVARINPKAIAKSELLGELNSESGLWSEGLLTKALRQYAANTLST